jgi:hypothetical protein
MVYWTGFDPVVDRSHNRAFSSAYQLHVWSHGSVALWKAATMGDVPCINGCGSI